MSRDEWPAPALDLLDTVKCLAGPGESLIEVARYELIRCAMWETKGNQKRAAKLLGISPRAMLHFVHIIRDGDDLRHRQAGYRNKGGSGGD